MSGRRKKRTKKRSIFGEQLEIIARERKLSHRELAQMAGVSISVIGSWIGPGGASPSDFHKVHNLSKALGVSFHWLLLGEHPPESGDTPLSDFYLARASTYGETLRTPRNRR